MSRKERASLAGLITDTQHLSAAPAAALETATLKPLMTAAGKPHKRVGLYLHPAVKREIDTIAFTLEKKPHDIYLEAVDLVLQRYGRKSVAALKGKA